MDADVVRILLADDHRLVAEGIRELLEPRHQVLGIVETGPALLDAVTEEPPDLVLADLSMPGLDGIETTRRLRQAHPALPIIILTMHDDAAHGKAALEAGASGYVVKSSAARELFEAINTVLAGETYISPKVASKMLEGLLANRSQTKTAALTPRESQIADLVSKGLENFEIAQRLCVAEVTVRSHFRRILHKLGLRNRVELARFMIAREPALK